MKQAKIRGYININTQIAAALHTRTERVEDLSSACGTLGQVSGYIDADALLARAQAADFALDYGRCRLARLR